MYTHKHFIWIALSKENIYKIMIQIIIGIWFW